MSRNPAYIMRMLRLRQIGLIALLLCALSHAWCIHDFLHGHHHDDLGEASYSTIWRGQAGELSTLLSSPALVTGYFQWSLPTTNSWIATVEEVAENFQAPHLLDPRQVPRPPPVFSLIA